MKRELVQDPLDLIVTGVGGQGNVLASGVLGRAILDTGYTVTVGETYGLSQRGGAVMSMVRVTKGEAKGPLIPAHRATAIISLEPLESLRIMNTYGHPDVVVLTNDRPLPPLNVISGADEYPPLDRLKAALEETAGRVYWIPATEVAMELGNPILANVVMLGALTAVGLLPVGLAELEETLGQMFPPAKMAANRQALARGRELAVAAAARA
ncbi:MAG: indolepyruvate oxidoreductase subunit beta [Deltaproteobacteria bacterium]|nr:indolepyruvate oxidoreductase subunit beta [Deltaproteobacteria bacterium]